MHFTVGDERDGQRCNLWLGSCCPHHREGQGDHPHAENQDGLKLLNLKNINHQVLSSDILSVQILDSMCPQQQLPGKFLIQSVPISEVSNKKEIHRKQNGSAFAASGAGL